MSTLIYRFQVVQIGDYVAEYLTENKIILFASPVPQDIADYCVVHQASKLTVRLEPGQKLCINQSEYLISAIGEVASENLRQLGHITLNFDGATKAELPGMVHLLGTPPKVINLRDEFAIYQITDHLDGES
nr:PTS glucitol/sorbitol transporter subunit IIA [uncultured Moellerella sp.]